MSSDADLDLAYATFKGLHAELASDQEQERAPRKAPADYPPGG
jgi:hypothetical protein